MGEFVGIGLFNFLYTKIITIEESRLQIIIIR